MSLLAETARALLVLSGASRRRLRRKLEREGNRLLLLFHRVLPAGAGFDCSPAGMVMTRESFGPLLDRLAERFDLLSPDAFFERYPAPLSRPSVLITFDDGWLDVRDHAWPEMKTRKIGGICFLSVRHIDEGALFWPERLLHVWRTAGTERLREMLGGSGPEGEGDAAEEMLLGRWKKMEEGDREELLGRMEREMGGGIEGTRLLSWEDAKRLEEEGMEMGSHGCRHLLLTRIGAEHARREIALSRERMGEMLRRPPRFFAYPNGESDEKVRAMVREAGYEMAFSIRGRPEDPYDLPRVNMHEGKVRGPGGRWGEGRLLLALGERSERRERPA